MHDQVIIAGIGTDVGKTVVSALLCQRKKAAYWKPIQAGALDNSDSDHVYRLVGDTEFITYPEAYRLQRAMSPHEAAVRENIQITLSAIDQAYQKIVYESDAQPLIVELAGGLMVPFNQAGETNLDLICHWQLPVIVVANEYLGSINHTLLTLEVLKQNKVNILGVFFNDSRELPFDLDYQRSSHDVISRRSGVPVIASVPFIKPLDSSTLAQCAAHLKLVNY